MSDQAKKVHYRACNLCEAICGLEITTVGREITSIRGDKQDPLSQGHICAKAFALKDLYEDPDRLTQPQIRLGHRWKSVDWDTAIQFSVHQLTSIRKKYGADAVAVYQGNPTVHNLGMMTHGRHFFNLLNTKNQFSATSVDQLPQQLVALKMYGHQLLLPVPDIDHTDLLILIGHNPLISNGSLMTAPGFKNRLKKLQARSGQLVTIDPRFTETAAIANLHLAPKPGTDFYLLAALVHLLLEARPEPPTHLARWVNGFGALKALFAPFTVELANQQTGIKAEDIQRLAHLLLTTKRAAIHGRLGISTHPQGTVCHWACQLINLITGNLDQIGGTLFAQPAIDLRLSEPGQFAQDFSRLRGLPDFCGEFPVACLAEEIQTPGHKQIRALVLSAGNPVLTTPAGHQLAQAMEDLEFCLAIDFYRNESTGLANVILPPTMHLEHDHYDLVFHHLSVRNSARFNQALWQRHSHQRHDWEIFNQLCEEYCNQLTQQVPNLPEPRTLIELGLTLSAIELANTGAGALTLTRLIEHEHGIDLGPLKPSIPVLLKTTDKKIHCAPTLFVNAIHALSQPEVKVNRSNFSLISRRDARSNNSWGHNSLRMTKGRSRFFASMHPDDMADLHIHEPQQILIRAKHGEIVLPVHADTTLLRGVVAVPFGWGHHSSHSQLNQAQLVGGASVNNLTDPERLDRLSGVAAFSGTPVLIRVLEP